MAKHTEWSAELENELSRPFPANVVSKLEKKSKKSGSSTMIDFVSWHHYVRRLNDLVGSGWSMGTPLIQVIGVGEDAKLLVGLPVTIFGVTRINFGTEDEDKDDYGDAATNAWAQSLKRTLALFGMGLDMYLKGKPGYARPASAGDIKIITALADERQVPSEAFGKLSTEISSGVMTADRAAEIIQWLRGLPKMENVNA